MKPFTAEDIHRSLAAAEDLMRGREALRPKMPVNLTLYDKVEEEEGVEPQPGFIPSRRSLKTRLEHWIAGTQH
jgi:two-component system, response regulator PdtaR